MKVSALIKTQSIDHVLNQMHCHNICRLQVVARDELLEMINQNGIEVALRLPQDKAGLESRTGEV